MLPKPTKHLWATPVDVVRASMHLADDDIWQYVCAMGRPKFIEQFVSLLLKYFQLLFGRQEQFYSSSWKKNSNTLFEKA